MKNAKNIFSLIVGIFVLIYNMSMTAYATTTEPPKGYIAEMCPLTFHVDYISSGDDVFKGNIAVVMTDIATNKEYQFLLKADKGYNASETYKVVANTTYKVSVTYTDADKFQVVNADGTEITSYHATMSGLVLTWQIKDNKSQENNSTHHEDGVTLLKGTGDASEMIKSFFEKTQFMANDSNYKDFLDMWTTALDKKSYLENKGNTEEAWNSMTKYEQACHNLLFDHPKSLILCVNHDLFAKDKVTFMKNLDFAKRVLNGLPKGDVVYDEIVKVWDWHWDNWEGKKTIINPFEGEKYGKSDQKQDETDLQVSSEVKAELKTDNVRVDLASPNTFLSILKNNIITILILILIGIAFAVVVYKNKKKNYGGED